MWRTSPGAPLPRDPRRRLGRGVAGGGERVRHLEHGARRPAGDVEGARDGLRRGEREHVRPRDVADVDEVAALAAVLEDARRPARGEARSGRCSRRPAYGVSRGIRGP